MFLKNQLLFKTRDFFATKKTKKTKNIIKVAPAELRSNISAWYNFTVNIPNSYGLVVSIGDGIAKVRG